MNKILIIGGNWDNEGGRPSKLIAKLSDCILSSIYEVEVNTRNGGNYSKLQDILKTTTEYDYVFWFANVSNDEEKVRDVKSINPKCLLITSKRNDDNKYDLEELLQRALSIKANLCFEFSKIADRMFNIRVFDPLGCVWYNGTDIERAVDKTMDRLNYLSTVTRKASVQVDGTPTFEFNEKDKEFLDFVKSSAETFHKLMCLPPDVKRFVGNASLRFKEPTRCMSGFPAIRKDDLVLISRRNVDKTGISEKDFVVCYLDENNNTAYMGENKPSVDSPVQLRLFKTLPNIDYILHGHCYIKNAPMTKRAIPCGAVEEVSETLNVLQDNYGSLNEEFYTLNLKGHGCLIMASAEQLSKMKSVEFYTRPLPELM